MADLPINQIIIYSFALWFGLYLLARHPRKPGMRYAGLGLFAYAVGLEVDTLIAFIPEASELLAYRPLIAVLPFIFWFASVRHLVPADIRAELPKRPLVVLVTGSIMFLLSIGQLLLPFEIISSDLAVLAIGLDLAVLSFAIAALDAYEEGEVLLPDFLRSLGASFVVTLLLGGQIVLVMTINQDMSVTMLMLLLTVITTGIALQVFSDPIQTLLDRALLSRIPRLQTERAELRAVASALPRIDDSLDISMLDEKEFTRLTRRALSHLGDVSRLASNPLTRLPILYERLAKQGQQESTLERAAELKTLLIESIERLKPRDRGDYGTSDEWRYYNTLHFPYVMGIKPYSRRNLINGYDEGTHEVLDWFRVQVPERTLHNWQNAAAKLIAQDLREQMGS